VTLLLQHLKDLSILSLFSLELLQNHFHTSYENDLETLRLNMKCKPHLADCYVLAPFPGTEIHKLAIKEKLIEAEENDYNKFRSYGDLALNHPPALKRKIENLQKLFLQQIILLQLSATQVMFQIISDKMKTSRLILL